MNIIDSYYNQGCSRLAKSFCSKLILILAILSMTVSVSAQTTVIMPHLDADTLYITSTGCYTILDPGGTGKYQNNEDSYLYIISDQPFYLQTTYEVGHSDDGKDWIHIYYDTVDWYGYDHLGGEGSRETHLWNSRALIHFHSNNYNSFDGFVMTVEHQSTMHSYQCNALSESSVRLTWNDNRSSASSWTVYYTNDDDTMYSAHTTTKSVVLNGLTNNRYYRYYIVNNITGCVHKEYQWFTPQHDTNIIIMDPGNWNSYTIPSGRCRHIMGPNGDTTTLSGYSVGAEFYFNGAHGVYLSGTVKTEYGEIDTYRRQAWDGGSWGESYYYWDWGGDRNERNYYQWFPEGYIYINVSERTRFDFEVLSENSHNVVPTVTGITANSATISWTDNTPSTSWTFRYCSEEGQWTTLNTTTKNVTLNGLQAGRQYVYTIEGNNPGIACMVPARHGFITTGNADTILMPYRGNITVTLQPGQCYTILDAGGNNNFFKTDYSRLVLRTSNHKGFRVKGRCNLPGNARLIISDGVNNDYYDGNSYDILKNSIADSLVIYFQSDVGEIREGFVLEVLQVDNMITNLRTTNVGATTATVRWDDASSATSWTVHYGKSEEEFQSVTVSSKQATLTGLTSGRQYVYYITRNNVSGSSCAFSERRAFITTGLQPSNVVMPYRGSDTLIIQPNTCYRIWDAGGKEGNYFNNDTSILVIMTSDGSDFVLDGEWIFNGNEAQYSMYGYDYYDRVELQNNPNDDNYYNRYDGWYNRYNTTEHIRYTSDNGYIRMRFISNNHTTQSGFCFSIDRSQSNVHDVKLTRVLSNSATVTWNDDSGATSWTISYGPVGGTMTNATSTLHNYTMNGLQPNTMYQVLIYSAGSSMCDNFATYFNTLGPNDIVMTPHSNDTVYITPGQCYYIYDPGGDGDYLPSDTSSIVIRSTTGEGFFYNTSVSVGNRDYSDYVCFSNGSCGQVWWGWDSWVWDGELKIDMMTNEALQERGFWVRVLFPSRVYNPDTLNMTNTSVTITWQDTSGATGWNFSYGPHIDSMTTVTTSVKQYTMTGLERNRQYFYAIYNTTENKDCVLENYYGVIMPTDAGYMINPYNNYYLSLCGRHSLYYNNSITLTPNQCYHFLDEGGIGRLFRNSSSPFSINTTNNQGITLEGYYDFGSSNMYISTSTYGSWYYNSGYLKIYAPDGYINFDQHTGTSQTDYAPGLNFDVTFNYKIYNVHAQNVTCTSANLIWSDSTSATQWTVVYGPTEKMLDTIVVNTKSVSLTNLLPDQQYVCYLTNNDNSLSCLKPVKYCFITTCDTTIIVFPYNNDLTRVLDINECYTILDGGAGFDYLYNDRHSVYLQSSTGNAMTLRGNVHMGDNDYLYVIDDITGAWLASYGVAENQAITIPSGRVRLEYNSAGDTVTGSGFEFRVTFHTIYNIQVSLKTDTTCRLTWDDNSGATQWVCHYGMDRDNMDSAVVNQRMIHLKDLVYGKRYYVFFTNNSVACIDTTWFEFCAGGDKCVEFGDIYSCFATAYYGRFNNPNEWKGMVDYGPDDINSRHTVIDDPTATDPHTGNQLLCVPPGHPNAVRLGNWDIGGEAESITYEYEVDTTKSEVLLLRYAAVLENPGHSPAMQPRFRFSLVDEWGNDINTDCYSADFVSSDALGWNTYQYDTNTVLWKDWTAVGVDLAPLHGQTVFVQLTTYDCNEMGHYGYAYFTLECEEKEMVPNECGVVHANTFTAPEGFRYRWYNVDSAGVTLSTDQTFSSNQNGVYKCRASFLGSTGENCFFEKTVVVGDIFPFANFSYEIIDTVDCNVVVQFYNRSCVTLDSAHTQQTSMECDDYVWDFGDGTVSYDKHPTHIFPSKEFNITLTASLAGGQCGDDTTQTVLMRTPCIVYDTVYPEICGGDTFALRDSSYTVTGNYTVRTEYREDSVVTTFVFLTVHPTLDTNLLGGVCDGNAYTLFGFNESVAGDYLHQGVSIYGCDSTYHLHLEVAHSYDTSVAVVACSNTGYVYRDTAFMTSTVFVDSLLSIYSCDSVVTLNVTINPAYNNQFNVSLCQGDSTEMHGVYYNTTGIFRDTLTTVLGCDSVGVLMLTVNPVYDTYDTDYFCLHTAYYYRNTPYWEPQLIVDSLQTVALCDSIVHIDIRLYDTTFMAQAFFSVDSINWVDLDSNIIAGCIPLKIFVKDSAFNPVIGWNNTLFFGDGQDSVNNGRFIEHIYMDSGIFNVVNLLRSDDGCVDTLVGSVQVFSRPIPDFDITPELISTLNPTAELINTSYPGDDSSYYQWYFYQHADNDDEEPVDSSALINPTYTWQDAGEDLTGDHDVKLIAYQQHTALNGNTLVCNDTVKHPVHIINILLQFPTAVTPNGDGVNDTWRIVNIEYGIYPVNRLRIYDRWGRLVFKRENITSLDDAWDPNDCDCPDGTYFFRFDSQGEPGFIQHNGAIEVLR